MSEACITGATLTDTSMCSILNTASMETLPADIRPAPATVDVTGLPANLQQAVTDCDGYSACQYIGYDFYRDVSQKASDTQYVLDTYQTSSENSAVLVKKSETSPGSGEYVQTSLPTILVEPFGYDLLPMAALNGTVTSRPTANNEEECASACDTVGAACVGFNFSARSADVTASCELYNSTSNVFSANKLAFVKQNIPNTNVGTVRNETFLGNQGMYCKNADACNSNVANIISNMPDVQKFTTTDLDACFGCPPRSFNRSNFTVTDELGVSQMSTASDAINRMRYDTDLVYGFADHLDIIPGRIYNFSTYVPQTYPFSNHCFIIPAVGTTDQYYIFTYSTFKFDGKENVLGHTSDGYSAGYAYSGDGIGTFMMTSWYFLGQNQIASNNDGTPNYTPKVRKYTAQSVPYVTNGYIFIDTETGKALYIKNIYNYNQASLSGTISTEHITRPPMYSDDYNKCIFVLSQSDWGNFTLRAGRINQSQQPNNFIKNTAGSEFLFDGNIRTTTTSSTSIVAAAPTTKKFFTTFYTTVLSSQFEWKYNSPVNLSWLLKVDLPDFWTYVNRP